MPDRPSALGVQHKSSSVGLLMRRGLIDREPEVADECTTRFRIGIQ
jgi:hypothetical protein